MTKRVEYFGQVARRAQAVSELPSGAQVRSRSVEVCEAEVWEEAPHSCVLLLSLLVATSLSDDRSVAFLMPPLHLSKFVFTLATAFDCICLPVHLQILIDMDSMKGIHSDLHRLGAAVVGPEFNDPNKSWWRWQSGGLTPRDGGLKKSMDEGKPSWPGAMAFRAGKRSLGDAGRRHGWRSNIPLSLPLPSHTIFLHQTLQAAACCRRWRLLRADPGQAREGWDKQAILSRTISRCSFQQ